MTTQNMHINNSASIHSQQSGKRADLGNVNADTMDFEHGRNSATSMVNILIYMLTMISASVFIMSGQAPWFLVIPLLALTFGYLLPTKPDSSE